MPADFGALGIEEFHDDPLGRVPVCYVEHEILMVLDAGTNGEKR